MGTPAQNRWIYYLALTRPLNLGIILFSFLLAYHITGGVDSLLEILLILEYLLLAAAGYTANDIHDRDADAINRPGRPLCRGLDVKKAFSFFLYLSAAAFLLNFVFPVWLFFFNLFVALLLLLYSFQRKKGLFLGNISVALATASPFGAVMLLKGMSPALGVPLLFSFFIIWMREITKDLDDREGDKKAGRLTLPLLAGQAGAHGTLWVLTFIFAGFTMWGSIIARYPVRYGVSIQGIVNLCNALSLYFVMRENYKAAETVYKVAILIGMGGLWLSV